MNKFKYYSILIILFWFGIFVLMPNISLLLTSFCEKPNEGFIQFSLTLENYKKLLSSVYINVYVKSLGIALYVTILSLLLSYPFVYFISQKIENKRIKDFFLLLVIIPFWTSSLIRTYAMMIILRANGLINKTLIWLGVIDTPIELLYNNFAVSIGYVYSLLPFMIVPLYLSFEKLNRNYINAAQDLGADRVMLLLKIIIPLTKSGIISGSILVFLSTFGMFFIPELLGGSKGILIGNVIKNQFLIAQNWPLGAAISALLIILIITLMLMYARKQKDSDNVII